ncbi:DUF3179 domain-containing protein [Maritimibacter fusiformis]|uniref:DUF3179 domain-containing protein n=1 Tax=Maritimibacter fusiformis TaxID=2603819 RepID=A0A5D0RME3_9RHOB|nr:DUF3179 domain-containing protein [Maritimibacter fusiformis]TYB81798.1 DUF3179 domain-containing protein [Maritimibacter fusiformis]
MRVLIVALAIALGLVAQDLRADPAFWQNEFPRTDFSRSLVADWSEVRDGGPGRDGIPALTDPDFVPVADKQGLGAREPVVVLALEGAPARAYPLRYLTWHEIVNDTVAGVPVAVTFCPLCNSAPVFDRRLDGAVLTFGVTGKLRHSDMVMYDRETESWWQQALGQGIVGVHAGAELVQLPSWVESWADFSGHYPDGLVMAEPEFHRSYGRNPYVGYDSRDRPYGFFTGEMPPEGIAALSRVVRVGVRGWPLPRLAAQGVIREAGLVITWRAGSASALDTARIAAGRDIGAIRVTDDQGRDVPHDVMFAFAFDALVEGGIWMTGD